jgi:hypothetical protein
MEHKQVQRSLRNQINRIEKEVDSIHHTVADKDGYKEPFILSNNKCGACHRELPDKQAEISSINVSQQHL